MIEADIQKEVVKWLRDEGYIVLITGQYNKQHRRTINTNGLPDLVIHHETKFPRGMALLIEMKKPGGNVREAQQKFYDQRGSYICESLTEVKCALQEFLEDTDRKLVVFAYHLQISIIA